MDTSCSFRGKEVRKDLKDLAPNSWLARTLLHGLELLAWFWFFALVELPDVL